MPANSSNQTGNVVGRFYKQFRMTKNNICFGLLFIVFLVISGCESRNLAPEANYDQQRVKQIREELDKALQE